MAVEDREWWRGNPTEVRQRIARSMELNDHTAMERLTDTMYIGDAAIKLMDGIARYRDVIHVMAELIRRCELEIRDKTILLLQETDSRSDRAQQLHFECRVCAGIISHLNQLVRESEEAAQQFVNQEEAP